MIAIPMQFLEKIINEIGIKNVIKEAAEQNQIAAPPYCHLIPHTGSVEKDFTKVRKESDIEQGKIIHVLRKWKVTNPIRVVFVAGKNCEIYGAKFLSILPSGFEAAGQWIDINVTSELPPLDDSLLYDAGEIAYDVKFTSGVYVPAELGMIKDIQAMGKIVRELEN